MKINILHTIGRGKIGGGETSVLNLAQMPDKNRFNSTVVPFTGGEMIYRLNRLEIT
jgi:hypothetical protein